MSGVLHRKRRLNEVRARRDADWRVYIRNFQAAERRCVEMLERGQIPFQPGWLDDVIDERGREMGLHE